MDIAKLNSLVLQVSDLACDDPCIGYDSPVFKAIQKLVRFASLLNDEATHEPTLDGLLAVASKRGFSVTFSPLIDDEDD